MVGPDLHARGGMTAVVNVYRAAGLFDGGGVTYLTTHSEGTLARKLWVATAAVLRLVGLLAKRRVALLHAHVAERTSFRRKAVLMLAALAFRRPVVFHLHSGCFLEFYRDELGALGKRVCQFLLRRAACVVVVATPWERMVREICPKANVLRLSNPVAFDPARVTSPHERDRSTLLFLGRFCANKGIYDLLRAVAILRDEFPELVLKAGGNDEVHEVKTKAGALGIGDRVHVLGWVGGEQKERLLATATLFVLPSHIEALGMGILEALATGLPVVATEVGGIPDAVRSGVEGLLVAPGDAGALCGALREMLRNDALRARCSAAGVETVRTRFAAEVAVQGIRDLHERVLARSPFAPGSAR
jgi:glycosyltransferase involved in cell wall biosynthesis